MEKNEKKFTIMKKELKNLLVMSMKVKKYYMMLLHLQGIPME